MSGSSHCSAAIVHSSNGFISPLTTIDIEKEDAHFSAAHFTLFSSRRRERLHGHDFKAGCTATAAMSPTLGMTADYGILKRHIRNICKELDEYVLLPGLSPWLKIDRSSCGRRLTASFNSEEIPFLTSDVIVLPITNVTLEELSRYILERLLAMEVTVTDDDDCSDASNDVDLTTSINNDNNNTDASSPPIPSPVPTTHVQNKAKTCKKQSLVQALRLQTLQVRVSSGPGLWGSREWTSSHRHSDLPSTIPEARSALEAREDAEVIIQQLQIRDII